jgi:hypothetical protein
VKPRCLRDVWPFVSPLDLSLAMTAIHQPTTRGDSSQKKGGRRRNENNLIYANPLPITFSRIDNKFAVTALGIFGVSPTQVLNPRCEGTFDPITRSVWITNSRDSMILWRRGFFGKGNLSRSEPSWLVRQSHLRATSGRRKPNHVYMWLRVLMDTLFRGNLRRGDSEAPS